jgi:hypothetical protein
MTESLPEAPPPRTVNPPVEATPTIAHRNALLGLSLFGIALLIAAGAVLVAFIYLHFD